MHERGPTTQMVKSTLEGVDARPSVRAPERDVPPELEAVCVKATALDPTRRFASAREMHDAIERFLDGERDVKHRRELARGHARAALAAAASAIHPANADPDADRTRALKEAARSLALDPTNTEAMEASLSLRAQPLRGMPLEVESQLAESVNSVTRSSAWFAAVVFGIALLYLPLTFLMGLREPSFVVATILLLAVSVATLVARSRHPRRGQIPIFIVATTLLWTLQARVAGPFIVLPGLIVANGVAYAMLEDRALRWFALIAGCAAVAVPALLEGVGTFGTAYSFRDGMITIVPRALSLPKTPTLVYFTLTAIGSFVIPFLYTGRLRAKFYDMQRAMTLQAWQFRQLVPEQVHEVAGAPGPQYRVRPR
jgi:hypothetical protein